MRCGGQITSAAISVCVCVSVCAGWSLQAKALSVGDGDGEFVFELLPGSIRRQTDLIKTGVRDRQPVSWNVDLGDFEVEVGHPSDRNAVTSCGEVEELLLQLEREGQHHVPETPYGALGLAVSFVLSSFLQSAHVELWTPTHQHLHLLRPQQLHKQEKRTKYTQSQNDLIGVQFNQK